ncbi:MAG: D-glycero-beta-D-manno-heptose 1-phosphate adenylyltransferase [Sphingobacteriia bacterium]|nr:D-glycero-beta-D-manno-heptose 1-phosphate adenylyltransferase [Sphingobacteriia bacterium]
MIYTAANKILTDSHHILKTVNRLRFKGKKIVFTNGCFDILHKGHVEYLEAAKNLGDFLWVGINTDDSISRLKGPERPLVSLEGRMRVLAALESVDWIIPFSQDTPAELIDLIVPDVLVKGDDYTPDTIVGASTVIANGGQVITIPLTPGFSTTQLVNKIKGII